MKSEESQSEDSKVADMTVMGYQEGLKSAEGIMQVSVPASGFSL